MNLFIYSILKLLKITFQLNARFSGTNLTELVISSNSIEFGISSCFAKWIVVSRDLNGTHLWSSFVSVTCRDAMSWT